VCAYFLLWSGCATPPSLPLAGVARMTHRPAGANAHPAFQDAGPCVTQVALIALADGAVFLLADPGPADLKQCGQAAGFSASFRTWQRDKFIESYQPLAIGLGEQLNRHTVVSRLP